MLTRTHALKEQGALNKFFKRGFLKDLSYNEYRKIIYIQIREQKRIC